MFFIIEKAEEATFKFLQNNAIHSQTTEGKYKQGDTIKFETETIKSRLCDYSNAFILVTGNITVAADNDIQMLRLKIVHHFLHVQQKLMTSLFMKQIIFILQCLCII